MPIPEDNVRKVYVPFSTATRCALADWYSIPSYHACAFAPPFADDAKLELVTREDLDRWKGLLSARAMLLVARLRQRLWPQREGSQQLVSQHLVSQHLGSGALARPANA